METIEWIKLLLSFIQTASIVVGGLYTYYEYRRFRRYSPKIQMEVDFNLYPIGDKSRNYLVDIEMTIKNVGQVRMYLPWIYVGINTLDKDDVANGLITRKRLYFTNKLVPKDNFAPSDEELARAPSKEPWWVDPGVTQVFPFPVVISDPNKFIQVNIELYYIKNIDKYKVATKEEKEKLKESFHQASIIKPIIMHT